MINKFLEYISTEKRYSAYTVTSYRKDLEDFRNFMLQTEGTADLCNADKRMVRNFMAHLSEAHLTKRSINRKLSTLRSFYLFLLKIGEISVSPLETIQSLKFYAEKKIPFSQEEMFELQDHYEAGNRFLESLIIEVLYQTGMRKAELCGLLHDHVDFSRNEIKVIGKGNKERVVPISEELASQLQNYLLVRKPTEAASHLFFVTKKGKKVTEKFVYLIVNSYLSTVTSKESKSPHILRHSFATHMLDNGAEISRVKKILGHSSLASTQVYTGANIEQLKKVYNVAHPRAGFDKNKNGTNESPEF